MKDHVTHNKLLDRLINKAKDFLDSFWADVYQKYKVDHVYKLDKLIYYESINKLKPKMKLVLEKLEKEYVENTTEPKGYPIGCIKRANRSWELFRRWDDLFRHLIPSYKVYS